MYMYPFSAMISLKWDWGGAKAFDVYTSSTHNNMAFSHALDSGWGEHCNYFLASTVYVHVYVLLTIIVKSDRM